MLPDNSEERNKMQEKIIGETGSLLNLYDNMKDTGGNPSLGPEEKFLEAAPKLTSSPWGLQRRGNNINRVKPSLATAENITAVNRTGNNAGNNTGNSINGDSNSTKRYLGGSKRTIKNIPALSSNNVDMHKTEGIIGNSKVIDNNKGVKLNNIEGNAREEVAVGSVTSLLDDGLSENDQSNDQSNYQSNDVGYKLSQIDYKTEEKTMNDTEEQQMVQNTKAMVMDNSKPVGQTEKVTEHLTAEFKSIGNGEQLDFDKETKLLENDHKLQNNRGNYEFRIQLGRYTMIKFAEIKLYV